MLALMPTLSRTRRFNPPPALMPGETGEGCDDWAY